LLEMPRENENVEKELKRFLKNGRICDNHT